MELRQRVAIDRGPLPVGELAGRGHGRSDVRRRPAVVTGLVDNGGRTSNGGWPDSRQPRAEVGGGPGAPQVRLSASTAEKVLDSRHHRVPVGRRAQQHRAVEEATWSAEIGHRHVVGIQGPPATGEREGGVERGVVVQVAAQQRVVDGDVALPTGGQLRLEHA